MRCCAVLATIAGLLVHWAAAASDATRRDQDACLLTMATRLPAAPGLAVVQTVVDDGDTAAQLASAEIELSSGDAGRIWDAFRQVPQLARSQVELASQQVRTGDLAAGRDILRDAVNKAPRSLYRGTLTAKLGDRTMAFDFRCWIVSGRVLVPASHVALAR